MLKQRINLLPPRVVVKKDRLCFDNVVGVCGVVLLLIVGWAVWAYWADEQAKSELARITAEAETIEQQYLAAESSVASRKPDAALLARQALLEKRIRTKRKLLTLMSRISPESHPGFSFTLYDVADAMPDNIWLTGLAFNNLSHTVSFAGATSEVALIPQFFGDLSTRPSFLSFHVSELKSNFDSEEGLHQFEAAGLRSVLETGAKP